MGVGVWALAGLQSGTNTEGTEVSNKLLKGEAFNQPPVYALTVLSPIPADDVLCAITVLISKRTNEVELSVQPRELLEKGSMAQDVLQLGLKRLKDVQGGQANNEPLVLH
jgi:hypothetical protein